MSCLKCGRDVEENQLFCQECLLVMEKYPVKPGTAIQLPTRRDGPAARKAAARRRAATAGPEEQLHRTRKRLRTLFVLWLLTLCLVAAAIYPTVKYIAGFSLPLPGQNYSTFSAERSTQP